MAIPGADQKRGSVAAGPRHEPGAVQVHDLAARIEGDQAGGAAHRLDLADHRLGGLAQPPASSTRQPASAARSQASVSGPSSSRGTSSEPPWTIKAGLPVDEPVTRR